jgi:hypothetical protein
VRLSSNGLAITYSRSRFLLLGCKFWPEARGSNIAAVSAGKNAFTVGGIITGLTPSTAYWFDVKLSANAGTATITGV